MSYSNVRESKRNKTKLQVQKHKVTSDIIYIFKIGSLHVYTADRGERSCQKADVPSARILPSGHSNFYIFFNFLIILFKLEMQDSNYSFIHSNSKIVLRF